MENPFQAAVLLSLDSLVVSLALSHLPLRPAIRRGLPVAFGFFDGLASFAGSALHLQASERIAAGFAWFASVLLIIYLTGFLFKSVTRYRFAESTTGRSAEIPMWPLYILPLLASIDNLVDSGTSVTALPPLLYALTLGCVSGLASFVGFGLGTAFSSRMPQSVRYASSICFLLLSVTLLLTQ